MEKNSTSRRNFIASSSAALAGITIIPSHVVSGMGHKAPSDKLNIAGYWNRGKRTDQPAEYEIGRIS